ncbi:hypothetical protein Y032_0182g892 [Ancylostoma ceylanicum]|nr:hypothetical protein Y032_0182g892 [Ancylostoma ceylanicum]
MITDAEWRSTDIVSTIAITHIASAMSSVWKRSRAISVAVDTCIYSVSESDTVGEQKMCIVGRIPTAIDTLLLLSDRIRLRLTRNAA